MQPWVLIDRAKAPDGAALELWRRGQDYSIRTAGHELMSSRMHGSEVRLAELGVAALGGPSAGASAGSSRGNKAARQRVLIGGLGCGYTLAAALAALGPKSQVVIAEISPAVVEWNRGELGALAGHPLEDPRVEVRQADVIDLLARGEEAFELILLDVDNGPSALSQARNEWLYRGAGIECLWGRLAPGGVLGVWSAGPDPRFVKRLRAERFAVEEHRVAAAGARGKRHVVWLARRSDRAR